MRVVPEALLHLGEGLYSNVPAVISEVVANAWDADATEVRIAVDTDAREIVVCDNGSGMDLDDINGKYLTVGYNRRASAPGKTPLLGRDPMGRKGIGKLSLFSISPEAEVHTSKRQDGGNERHGFRMSIEDMKAATAGDAGNYEPEPLEPEDIGTESGTLIRLRDVRLGTTTIPGLRRQLARRFSILGPSHEFEVRVNGDPIEVTDRDYFQSMQYVWEIGKSQGEYVQLCRNSKRNEHLAGDIGPSRGYEVYGWIGTFGERKQLGKDDNAITLLARGKLIEENVLNYFDEGGLYTKYVIGELHVDFFDQDNLADIATSDRQSVKQHDERFALLVEWLLPQLKRIESKWGRWREEDAAKEAVEEFPVIQDWMQGLSNDHRHFAEKLFGKIGTVAKQSKEARAELYRNAIVAFHALALNESLARLEQFATGEDLEAAASVISDLDFLEIIHYGHIVKNRYNVLKGLEKLVDQNAKEAFLQAHIYDHLWLLDPSWERATTDARMEARVKTEWRTITDSLTDEEKNARLDVYYRTAARDHIIIELKRSGVSVNVTALIDQLSKYRSALQKLLHEAQIDNAPIRCVVITGKPLDKPGADPNRLLEAVDAKCVTYESLIQATRSSYQDFIRASKELQDMEELVGELQRQATTKK